MKQYGLLLKEKEIPKGEIAIKLAEKLHQKAVDYFTQEQESKTDLDEFKDDFETFLNSKNHIMGEYRASWTTIVGNIALALTGIGVLFIAAQLIYSKVVHDRVLFFGQQPRTTGEEKIEEVKRVMVGL